MTPSLADVSWPAARLGEAMSALCRQGGLNPWPGIGSTFVPQPAAPARASASPLLALRAGEERAETTLSAGLTGQATEVGAPPDDVTAAGGDRLGRWVEAAAAWLGVEAEPVEAPYPEVHFLICSSGPALVRLPGAGPRFLAVLGGSRRRVTVLTPDHARVRLAPEVVRAALCREVEAPLAGDVERVLGAAGIAGRRGQRVRSALLGQLLAAKRVGGCWLLRPAGGTGLWEQGRAARLPGLLAAVLGAHACAYGLWLLSWWLLGWMALTGRLDTGWLLAWLLLLMTLLPFRLLTTAAGGLFSIRAGAMLKRRLLFGALRLDADEVRHLGAGQLLGRVLESEVVELMALTGAGGSGRRGGWP